MEYKPLLSRFNEQVATRKLARSYPWILGLVIFQYLITFPYFKAPILAMVPVSIAGWFYYRRGGVITGLLFFIGDFFLVNSFSHALSWRGLFEFSNLYVIGHVLILIAGMGVGFLRRELEAFHSMGQRLQARERHLTLIGMATRDILEMRDADDGYYRLLAYLTNLFIADYAYLTYWDRGKNQVQLVASTMLADLSSSIAVLKEDEEQITRSILQSGHILFIEDVQRSEYSVIPASFRDLKLSPHSALAVPLATKDYSFGAVILVFDTPRHFTREDLSYYELTMVQVALALKSAQQERRIAKRLREVQALSAIEMALSESEKVGLNTVLQLIVDSAKDLIPNTTHAVLHLLDDEQRYLIPRAFSGDYSGSRSNIKMQIGEGIAGLAISSGKTIAIPDVRTDPRFLQQTLPVTYRSLIVSPVQINKRRIGTISIHSDEVGIFDSNDIDLLSALGSQVAIAIENADLLETTRESLREINALYHVSRSMTSSLDAKQLMRDTVEFLQKIFKYYHIQVFLADSDGHMRACYGAGIIGNRLETEGFSLPAGSGIVGYVAETKEPFFTNDVDEVVFYVRNPLLPETKSEMALPIKTEDTLIGILDVQETASNPISLRHMKLISMVGQQMALALQKANLYTDLQAALNQEKTMRSQLMQNERLAVVGRLLASVSHELNNPLQAIQNALFLLQDEKGLSMQGHQDLEVVLAETERMASLIGRLRATYRPPQAEDFQDISLNTIIEDIYALTSTYMRHRKIAFDFRPEAELPIVPGIPDQIRQVLLNLFMNAIEAMRTDGKLMVQTESLSDSGQVLLTVSDTGAGIAPDILPRIFEPFVTDKDTGTGLGMTITRDIILQHHGEILAENNPEGGATFTVRFPIKNQE